MQLRSWSQRCAWQCERVIWWPRDLNKHLEKEMCNVSGCFFSLSGDVRSLCHCSRDGRGLWGQGAVSKKGFCHGSVLVAETRLVHVLDQSIKDNCIAGVGQFEKTDELLLDMEAERESFWFSLNYTNRWLREVKYDLFNILVKKKALVQNVIMQNTEIYSLAQRFRGRPKRWKRPLLLKTRMCNGKHRTLSMLDLHYIGNALQIIISLITICSRETREPDSFAQNTRWKRHCRCDVVQERSIVCLDVTMTPPHPHN